jgi:predicted transcriptional regulator
MVGDLLELLQSAGPIALNELMMRSDGSPKDLVSSLQDLKKRGFVVVKGPAPDDLSTMTADDIAHSSDTLVALSREGVRRSFVT